MSNTVAVLECVCAIHSLATDQQVLYIALGVCILHVHSMHTPRVNHTASAHAARSSDECGMSYGQTHTVTASATFHMTACSGGTRSTLVNTNSECVHLLPTRAHRWLLLQ